MIAFEGTKSYEKVCNNPKLYMMCNYWLAQEILHWWPWLFNTSLNCFRWPWLFKECPHNLRGSQRNPPNLLPSFHNPHWLCSIYQTCKYLWGWVHQEWGRTLDSGPKRNTISLYTQFSKDIIDTFNMRWLTHQVWGCSHFPHYFKASYKFLAYYQKCRFSFFIYDHILIISTPLPY